MNYKILFIFITGLLSAGFVFGQSGIGINLNFAEQGGTYVNIAWENYRWTKDGSDLTTGQVDVGGWPTVDADFVFDNRPVAEWSGEIDDPEEYRVDLSGTYKCSFVGQADVTVGAQGRVENLSYDEQANLTTFDFVMDGALGAGYGFIILRFGNTRRTPQDTAESGFTDFKMHRPGYPLDTPKIFTDAFLAALTAINFEAIRFMPFVGANTVDPEYPATTEWSARKLLTDGSQAPIPIIGKRGGASWDLVISLANLVRKDVWICVPASATTDYIQNLAQLFLDNLDPSLNIYLENSNEVWNNIFPQQPYNVAEANALGIGEHENHARRTVQLARIFGSVFGPGSINTRLRAILCSHAPMVKWWVEPMLTYVQQNIGDPAEFIYGISSQAYFGIPMTVGQSIPDILSEAHDNITAQIDETGGTNESGRMQWVAMADKWNLPGGYFVYEGGGHPELGNLDNIHNVITTERDSLMGELLKYNYGPAFLDVGGRLAMHFILSSAYTRYGSFGLTDDIAIPDRNYKYDALKELAGPISPTQTPFEKRGVGLRAVISVSGQVHIEFELPAGTHYHLDLHRLTGVSLQTLGRGIAEGGRTQISWGGGKHGLRLSPGVYVVRLYSGSLDYNFLSNAVFINIPETQ